MRLLYNFIVRSYVLAIYLAQLSNRKARLWMNGRKGWKPLLAKLQDGSRYIWFHCASAGELEDCAAILLLIKRKYPEKIVLLTFFSPSGYIPAVSSGQYDHVFYLPVDTPGNAKYFLDCVKPDLIFFSRSELWFHFLVEIGQRKIPAFLLGLALTEDSGFLKYRKLFRKALKGFTHICCRDELTLRLLKNEFHITDASVTGNPRYDRVLQRAGEKTYPEIEKFKAESFCIVVGSALSKDIGLVLRTMQLLEDLDIKWIFVPHEPRSKACRQLHKCLERPLIFPGLLHNTSVTNTMIVETTGDLRYLYRYADLALVGGGFSRKGIHNILEPACYGVPVAFGPQHRNYQEALDLQAMRAAHVFCNAAALERIIRARYQQRFNDELAGQIMDYIQANAGTDKRIVAALAPFLPKVK